MIAVYGFNLCFPVLSNSSPLYTVFLNLCCPAYYPMPCCALLLRPSSPHAPSACSRLSAGISDRLALLEQSSFIRSFRAIRDPTLSRARHERPVRRRLPRWWARVVEDRSRPCIRLCGLGRRTSRRRLRLAGEEGSGGGAGRNGE